MNAPLPLMLRQLQWQDSFRNLVAGLGVPGRDKAVSQVYWLNQLSQQQLEAAYRGDWIARKVVDIPAFDSTRAWRSWHADPEQIELIENTEKAFGLQHKLLSAITKARLYGGSCIIIGVDQGKWSDPLEIDKIKKGDLKFVHVVGRYRIAPGPIVRDLTSPWFGEPAYYMRTNIHTITEAGFLGQPTPALEEKPLLNDPSAMFIIHPSRVVRLIGVEYPDFEDAPDQWGDSCLQSVNDTIRDVGLVTSSIATIVAESKVDVYKLPGLSNTLSTDAGTNKLLERLSNANVAKSVINALLVDKEEEWQRITASTDNLDKILAMYLAIAAGAADIPATRFLGREPAGLNATGESDIRNYYDRLSADQNIRITPKLTRFDEVFLRHIFGTRDPAIYYEWNSLWQTSDTEKATIAKDKAAAFKIDVDCGILDAAVLKAGRENQLIEDGLYPGLEAAIEEFGTEPDEVEANPPPAYGGGGKAAAAPGADDPASNDNNQPQPKKKVVNDRQWWHDVFDPDEPRNEHGEWTSGGVGGGPVGHGYTNKAKLIKGVIYTSDVHDAARALYEGRKVQLDQPDEVSTLIDLLGNVSRKFADLGEKAPVFDLCNVSVSGTNLFCADSKGIPRVQMPQLTKEQTKQFIEHLKDSGYEVEKTTIKSSYLRATQDQLDGAKVASNMARMQDDPSRHNRRLVVSRDNYILDGHHHWAAQIGIDTEDNKLGGIRTRVERINIGIVALLKEAEKFTGGKGHKAVGDYDPNQPREPAGSPTGGQWAGGAAEFVSPNVGRLDFVQATKEMQSPRHKAFVKAAAEVNKITGVVARERDVVGAWSDGAENSTMMVSDKLSHSQLRVNAAMKGYLAHQKAVLVFQDDPQGPHQLYEFSLPGTLTAIHDKLLAAGIEFHTLAPRPNGADVIVADMNHEAGPKIDKLGVEARYRNGTAEFIGTQKEDGTDEDQRQDALAHYSQIIEGEGSTFRGVWQELRDRWSAPLATNVTHADTAPRALYVYRPLVNVADVKKWAKSQGLELQADPHVTVLYSKTPVDWMLMGRDWCDEVVIPPGEPRVIEELGDEGSIVLHFLSYDLMNRHNQLVNAGGSHDYETYQPHMTICYPLGDDSNIDASTIEPYRGELVFGPEVFKPIGG